MTIALWKRPLAQVVNSIVKAGNGCWLDPSDMSTIFQDAAGTIPVTAVEQPVGLMLDKSQGLMLGTELVSNGTFDSGIAGWEQKYNATTSYSSGSLKVMPTIIDINGAFAGQAIPTAIGRSYKVTFDLVTANATTYIRALNNTATPWVYTYGIAGAAVGNKITLVFTATATVTYIAFGVSALESLTNAAVYDNISVRELYGYHATQSVTASRPVLSAMYNLLTKTEDFSNAAWVKEFGGTGSTPVITQNYATAPDGSNTATRIVYALNGGAEHTDFSRVYQPVTLPANTQTVVGVWVKSTTGQAKNISISMTGANPLVVTVGSDWVFVSNAMIRSDNNYLLRFELRGLYGTSDSADILIWHPDLRIGTTPGPYQRVNTATNYDTNPALFPKYLKFDAVDDYLNLPFMNLYGGGAASIICARDAVSQSVDTYILSERSTSNANPKYFPSRQLASAGNMDAYISDDTAAVVLDTTGSAFSGASDKVIRSVVDTGNNIKLFKNGVLAANDNYARSGTLTLNNTTIGASVSTTTSNYASMKLYGLIITKSALTDAQRVRCERFLAQKAGVML